jgi:hypothetical protein
MEKELRRGRVRATLGAMFVIAAIVTVFAITVDRSGIQLASSDQPAGASGMARPHPPLDRAPGEPLHKP